MKQIETILRNKVKLKPEEIDLSKNKNLMKKGIERLV